MDVGCEVHTVKSVYFDGKPVLAGEMELMGQLRDGTGVSFKRAEGAKVVGRPIGRDEWVQASIAKTLSKQMCGLDHLWKLPPDVALLLLTFCINTRPMYLSRNLPLEVIGDQLRAFDARVDKCLANITQAGYDQDDWGFWFPRLRGLPVDLGGIALPRLAEVCGAAHTSCLVEALVGLLPCLGAAKVHSLMEHLSTEEKDAITHYLPYCKGEDGVIRLPGEPSRAVPGAAPELAVDQRRRFEREMARARQYAICKTLYKVEHKDLHRDLLVAGQYQRAALLLSAAVEEKQLSRWIRGGIYQNLHNRLNSQDFTDAVRRRLLVREYQHSDWVCGCAAKASVRDNPWHLICCPAAGGPITGRHDRAVEVLEKFCVACVGGTGAVHKEVQFERRDEQELAAYRMDLVVTTALGTVYRVDLAVTSACALSRSVGTSGRSLAAAGEGAAHVKGYAASVREADKRARATHCLDADELGGFIPFVVETTGLLGEAARGFLDTLGQGFIARVGDEGQVKLKKLRTNLFLELGMVLARGTARILQSARSKMSEVPLGRPAQGEWRAASPLGDDIGNDLGEVVGDMDAAPEAALGGDGNHILYNQVGVNREGDGPFAQ